MAPNSPPADHSRVELDNGLVGILSQFVYVWIVPGATGVILVDAGVEPAAESIRAELVRQGKKPADVKAILITHGHHDHCAGVAAFPAADVYIMPHDVSMLKAKPTRLRELSGDRVMVDSQTFGLFLIPGHTGGSVAFVWQNVCFVGDVITKNGGVVAYGPDHHSQSPEKNRESVRTLLDVKFRFIATGHGGIVTRSEFEAFVQQSAPPSA